MTRLLKKIEFEKTFLNPHELQDTDDPLVTNFWDYYDEIPESHFEGHIFLGNEVSNIYRMDNSLDHILISSNNKNIFLVLVNSNIENKIIGHYLLNLEKEYGLK